jgi:GDP-L-fucose synthase
MIRKMVDAQRQGNAPVELWGDGSPTRDFLYVQDAARAIVSAAASYDRAEPINLGSGREVLMSHLAEQIQAVVGHQGRLRWDSNRPNGQPRRVLDASSARAAIGFEPQVELTEGLRRTHQWYLENELQILDKERGRSS